MRLCSLLLIAALLAPAAQAEESADASLRSMTTADATRGWEGVGRLNLGNTAFCTGALIAPNLVLTAAHCLYDKTSGKPFSPGQIEFLAGWRNGRAVAYRNARRAVAHPDYSFDGSQKMDRVAFDLALIELDQPIRLPSIQPFEVDTKPRKGDEVGVVSYALDRSEAPSIQEICHVLAQQPGVLVMSCDVDFGSSGAPIFSIRDGVARIVSVVSAKAELDSRMVSLGSSIDGPLQELKAILAADTGRFMTVAPGKVLIGGAGSAGASGGAKFVRP
jgi:V8-like Glu-specific endopeptidase